MNIQRLGVVVLALGLAACQRTPEAKAPVQPPPVATQAPAPEKLEPVRESPPESGPAHEVSFPKPRRDQLPNGVQVDLVAARALPLVQLRVIMKAGTSADGDLTGAANLTAHMLKDGGAGRYSARDLLAKVETLGADLGIDVGPDATTLSLAVTRSHFEEALDVLGSLAREPRWDSIEFDKLKKRQVQRASDRAKSSGTWDATMLLWRDLFRVPTGSHPYGSYDATAGEIGRIKLADCRDFYRKYYVPKNAVVVLAGDLDLDVAKRSVERVFGSWRGADPATVSFAEPTPPEQTRILLADRPKSAQTDLYVAVLGPERRDDAWTDAKVVNQVLGGGVSGRLFLDIREKQSLAYNTRSSLGELARGPVPLAAYAGTQTAKTGVALKALLDNLKRISTEEASESELDTARRYLTDIFAIKMETVGSIADMIAALEIFGLPEDYYDSYRKRLGNVTARDALAAASEAIREGHLVIAAAGDADRIGPALSHFGDVLVFNPEKEFEKVRTIPANPAAPIEVERTPGE